MAVKRLISLKPAKITVSADSTNTTVSQAQAQAVSVLASSLKTVQGSLATKLAALKSTAGAGAAARLAHFQALSQAVTVLNQEYGSLPAPSSGSFIIHGRIVDASGNPLPNYILKINDPANSLQDRIPPVPSNSQGFFTVSLRAAEFPDLVKDKTNLFITVTDKSGREAFAPENPVQLAAGKVAVFNAVDQPSESA